MGILRLMVLVLVFLCSLIDLFIICGITKVKGDYDCIAFVVLSNVLAFFFLFLI